MSGGVEVEGSILPATRFGRVIVLLPSPYQSIFGVNDLANVSEAALDQDASRSVLLSERVSADDANLPGAKREND